MAKKLITWDLEEIKVVDVIENPANPKKLNPAGYDRLKKTMSKYGVIFGGIVNKDRMIIDGHSRKKELIEQGIKTAKFFMPSRLLSPEEYKELNAIFDLARAGDPDLAMIEELFGDEFMTEWQLNGEKKTEVVDDNFEVPSEVETTIVIGDLIEIGQHRLLCGDSTNADHVAKLLNGKEPYLMVTDPPYGVSYDPEWRHKAGVNNSKRMGAVKNDDNADWTKTWALSPSKVLYVWHGGKHTATVQRSIEDAGFEVRCQIIWNKQQFVFSRGDYHWKHEPCWYAVKKGCKGNWAGSRSQTTVWDIQSILQSSKTKKEDAAQIHGTQKPVECMYRPIQNHDGDVYDPFIGSGTTMVAAHQSDRICYAMDIDPKYCQIVIDRMKLFAPDIKVKVNGK